jgi:hypothetical protein
VRRDGNAVFRKVYPTTEGYFPNSDSAELTVRRENHRRIKFPYFLSGVLMREAHVDILYCGCPVSSITNRPTDSHSEGVFRAPSCISRGEFGERCRAEELDRRHYQLN